jgi:uncharacterized phage-like protein YoqJ
MSKRIACAFAGQKPSSFSFGYDEENMKCRKLKLLMSSQIMALIDKGVTTFLTGMSLGADMWGSEIVLECKRKRPDLKLIAVLPCETQADKWSVEQRERYFNLLAECDEAVYASHHYTLNCTFIRDRWLIDHANFVLATFNGNMKSNTAYIIRYAYDSRRTIITINPDTLEVFPPAIETPP